MLNSSEDMVETISDMPIGTGLLAFRDLNQILKEHVQGKKALDFGCGAGRSTRLLSKYGFYTIGADISLELITKAREKNHDIKYIYLDNECFDFGTERFNLILLSFVLMEIPKEQQIVDLLKRLTGYLETKGVIAIITASDHLYKKNWLSMKTKFKENINPRGGDIVKIFLKDYDINISDYYWSEKDYKKIFKQSNLQLIQSYFPLGKKEENKKWEDEIQYAPFVIYLLENNDDR